MLERLFQPSSDLQWQQEDRRSWIVLLSSTVLLVVFYYFGRPGFYVTSGLSGWASELASGGVAALPSVGRYLWWGLASLVLRVALPVAIIVWWLRSRPVEFGFRLRGISRHLPAYAAMYLVMFPVLFWASGLASFLNYYPFYSQAVDGGWGFWLYEVGYGLQFVGVEAFFRGFLLFGLLPRFGALSVAVMTVPYTMIHFAKPMPEAFAAIAAGLILGVMAIRSRSFVPGILLHVAVAVTMDLLVLWRLGALGNLL